MQYLRMIAKNLPLENTAIFDGNDNAFQDNIFSNGHEQMRNIVTVFGVWHRHMTLKM